MVYTIPKKPCIYTFASAAVAATAANLQFCRNLVKYFAIFVRHNECMRGIQ